MTIADMSLQAVHRIAPTEQRGNVTPGQPPEQLGLYPIDTASYLVQRTYDAEVLFIASIGGVVMSATRGPVVAPPRRSTVFALGRIQPHHLSFLLFTFILFLGGLIDWPIGVELSPQRGWANVIVLLFPLGYGVTAWTAQRVQRPEVIALNIGLTYGGVLWLQIVLDLCFTTDLSLAEKWDYVQGHAYDLIAVAAIVGGVGYFTMSPKRYVRMISLALVLTLTAAVSGSTEAVVIWMRDVKDHIPQVDSLPYPYWVLPILWAATGAWYGLCVGYRPPAAVLARAFRGEQYAMSRRDAERLCTAVLVACLNPTEVPAK